MRYSLRDLIALVAASAVWLWVVTQVSMFALPTLLAILGVSLHISAVRSLHQIKQVEGQPGPKVYLGPVKSVHIALCLCSFFLVIGAALSLTGVLLRPSSKAGVWVAVQEFPIVLWRRVTDQSFLGQVASIVSSQPFVRLSDLFEFGFFAGVGSLWSFSMFPVAVVLRYLMRIRCRIPVLALAFDGLLVRRNRWKNWVDFVPWGAIEAIGETRIALRKCITVRLHDPTWLRSQSGWIRPLLWRINRRIGGYDFCFCSSGWCGVTGKDLLSQLQGFLARPELRSLLVGAWRDERVQKWYDRAKQDWTGAEGTD